MTMQQTADVDLMDVEPFVEGREHELYAKLRAVRPLHWNREPDGPGFWSATRYADVVEIVSDAQTFINSEGTQILSRRVEGHTPTVHNTDPPRHTELRKVATPLLRLVRIAEWQSVIDAAVDEILDDLEGKDEVEIVDSASALLPIRALGQVLGVPKEDCGLLLDWTNRVVSDDPEYMRGPDEKERARNELFAYFAALTEERRARPRNDLVSSLAAATIDGEPLSWEDLAAYYFVLVGAGNETTRNLLTGSIIAFDRFPDEWRRLAADRTLLRPAVEEMLRYVTPIRAMRRTASRDVEFGEVSIAAGDKVVCWFQSANRDPSVFTDPDVVRIDRSPNPHIGFGWGIHACLGMHLARAEAYTFFGKVLERGLRFRPLGEPDRLRTNQFHAFKRLNVAIERDSAT